MLDYLIIGGLSFALAFIIGPQAIPLLRRLKFGQTIRDDGPETHLQKNGTPTMGGFIFILPIVVVSVFSIAWLDVDAKEIGLGILSMLLFGFVGLSDDYIKVIKHRSLGLNARQKIRMQFVFSLIVAIISMHTSNLGTAIYIPFAKTAVDIGIFYIPFVMFVIIALVNSVNLTDGLDGLASSVTIVVSIGLAVIAYKMSNTGLTIFLVAMIGALAGFLRVNAFPAQIFMGDTGSMALGGAVSAAVILMNIELIVPVLCIVYFMESLSVIIQVLYFKKTGKRFFRMAPIHHHFEKLGWHETKVVRLFLIITIVTGAVSTLSILSL